MLLALAGGALANTHRDPSGYVYGEHSIQKPYLASGMSIPNWDIMGHTVVADEFIRLTPDRQSKRGALWNIKPCLLHEWEVTMQFKVHGQGTHLFGDGFALWYTRDRGIPGRVFGNQDSWVGLGIFFDTYSNHPHASHGHPYISAIVSDGTFVYDHDADGTHQEVAGCQSFFRNVDFDTFIRITYRNRRLDVLVDTRNDDRWETCFSVPDVYLPQGYYFGLSAATGDLADNHDVISFKVGDAPPFTAEELEMIQMEQQQHQFEEVPPYHPEEHNNAPHAAHHAPLRPHVPDPPREESSSWTWIIVLLVLVAVVGGGAYCKFGGRNRGSRFDF